MPARMLTTNKREPGAFSGVVYALLAALFLLSRLVYLMAGVGFDSDPLLSSLALLDPELLRNDLARSILYLHGQPPLFNLFVGLLLKLFGSHVFIVARILYMSMGLLITLTMQIMLSRWNVPLYLSLPLTIGFTVAPSTVLFENLLFYTYPLTLLLLLGVLCLDSYLRTDQIRFAWLFFAFLGIIVLTRSLFHPLWYVLVAAALIALRRQQRKMLLAAASIPLLLIALWAAKNAILFGSGGSSTWLGMSLSKMITVGVPTQERVSLVNSGDISPFALRHPFEGIDEYRDLLSPRDSTGIPVLDMEVRTTGNMNLNNLAYLEISRHSMSDALTLIRMYPLTYLRGIVHAAFIFFRPASEYVSLYRDRPQIAWIDRPVNLVILGQWRYERSGFEDNSSPIDYAFQIERTGVFIAILYIIVFVWSFRNVIVCAGSADRGDSQHLLAMFLLSTILYVATVGNLAEIGENCRFRFMVDPLFIMLFALLLKQLIDRAGGREASP
ncbi:MAG TPA: hypothetical protein VL126_12875 [Bacteroidota bacterium]|nr:hypothetical protein [Bacteroidota bacterium]